MAVWAVVLVVLAGVTAVTPKVRRDGALSVVPTRALVAGLGWASPGGAWDQELRERLGVAVTSGGRARPAMSEEEMAGAVEGLIAGGVGARPGSARWERTYGAVWDALRAASWVLTAKPDEVQVLQAKYGPAVIAAFEKSLELPVKVKARARERIPEGVELPIEVVVEHRWPAWWTDDCELVWTPEGGKERRDGFRGYRTLKVAGMGPVEVRGEIVVRGENMAPMGKEHGYRELWRESVVFRTRVEPAGTAILTPVRSAELDQLLASTVKVELSRGMVAVWPGSAANAAWDDCAFALQFEVYEGEEKLVWGRSRWQGLKGTSSGATSGHLESDLKWPALQARLKGAGPFVVRVKSDPVLAFECLDAVRLGEGSFEVTVGGRSGKP
jgi:hypothetical protein